jgi:acyl carrier protein
MPETINKEEIQKRLTEAMVEFGEEPGNITREALFEQLDIDSLDLVEMAQIIDEEYEVEITDAEMDKLKTVGDAIDYVAEHAK